MKGGNSRGDDESTVTLKGDFCKGLKVREEYQHF